MDSVSVSDSSKISLEKIRENLQTQLVELESVQSVFCNAGEIQIEDFCVLFDMKNFAASRTDDLPQYLDITVNLLIDDQKFQLCVTLPHKYPHKEPEIFVRNHTLNRQQHIRLNKELVEYISKLERGEPCIFSAISWLQDNARDYVEIKEAQAKSKEMKNESFIRYWIYSHHIYSKTKRREILDLATRLGLCGFCMPGKPGIVCVEGNASDCTEWWQSIKSMNWKKIFCKVTEEDKGEDVAFLKFDKFEEVVFQNSGIKFNHMDMGELHQYLQKHSLGYIFKDLFGIDSKSSS